MPVAIHAPSLVLDAAPALSAQDRHDITQTFESTLPEVSLEGGDHVARVMAASFASLDLRTRQTAPELRTELGRIQRVLALLPVSEVPWDAPVPSGELTLWSVARRVDLKAAEPRLLLRLGALFYVARTSFARPSQAALRAALEAAQAAGTDRAGVTLTVLEQVTNDALARVLSKLMPRARSQESATHTLAERRVEQRWGAGRAFSEPRKQTGLGDPLTGDEVIVTAGHVRRQAEGGDMLAYLIALAFWIGLWLWELLHIEVFGPRGTGLIRISDDCTHAVVDLRGVLGDLARPGADKCKSSDLLTVVVFPKWIAAWLRALRNVHPDKTTLSALTGLDLRRSHWRVPGLPEAHARRLTVHRFIDARSAPLAGKAHQHVIALGNLDFDRAEKSAYPYPAVALAEIHAVQKLRAEQLKWGEVCELPALPHEHVGSRNTPLRSAIVELVRARQQAVESAPHGPNTGWDLLTAHHNQFVRYVLVLCTLAWMLRGRLSHALPASMLRLFVALGWRDKVVPAAGCPPAPLVCGSILHLQLQLLQAHLHVLRKRLAKRTNKEPARVALVQELERIARGEAGVSLLQHIGGNVLRPLGAQDLGAELPIGWKFSADALRHFGTDGHRELGTSAEMIELFLRHAGNGFELFSTSCGVALREWEADAGHAQDRLLLSLEARALPGLVAALTLRQP